MANFVTVAAALAMTTLPSLGFGYTLETAGKVFAPSGYYYDSSSCDLRDGTRLNLRWEYTENGASDLRLEHRSSDFTLLDTPLPIRVAEMWNPEISCTDDGEALVSWSETNCVTRYRVISADHRNAGDILLSPIQGDCFSGAPTFALWNGGFASAWRNADSTSYHSDIWMQTFDRSGVATLEPMRVSSSEPRWRTSPAAGADREGNVVVSWEEGSQSESTTESAIVAVAVTAGGNSTGAPLEVVRGPYELVNWPAVVRSPEIGLFDIIWTTDLAGRYVAQPVRIAELGQQTTTTTTTTTTLEGDPTPVFGDEHGWPSFDISEWIYPKLASDGKGGWLVMWSAFSGWWGRDWRVISTSHDGGRSWSTTSEFELDGRDITSAPGGEWVIVGSDWSRDYDTNVSTLLIKLMHSSERGTRWDDVRDIARFDGPADDDCWTRLYDLKIARSRSGPLVVVWAQATSCDNRNAENTVDRAFSIRSLDGGKTWSEPLLVWTKSFEGYENGSAPTVSLVPVSDHSFFILLSGEARVAMRSDDDGDTWSAPISRVLPDHPRCDRRDYCLAVSDGGTWISADGGVSWSESLSNTFDSPPVIATDDEGVWTAAWTSHRSVGGQSGPDADLLLASSSDGGRTWGSPRVLNRSAPSDGWMRDDEAALGYAAGSWVALWSRRPPATSYRSDSYHRQARVATAFTKCGNDTIDIFEQCDDGNQQDGDGCDSNCYATGCPNGITTAWEECDDGNDLNDDDCVADCRIATCGDGFTQFGVEECDDTNSDDTDACTNWCTLARCGDGIVAAGAEECDDGNTSNEDDCPTNCTVAHCGDGFILDGVEECDDANSNTTDFCPADCRIARCGDGYVWSGIELCDTAASKSCPNNCGLSECGDADRDGAYTASDALAIVQHAVGIPTTCPMDNCDVDGNFWISARDSLITLGLAVGLDYTTRCTGGPWLTVRLQDTRTLGALQLRIDLAGAAVSVLRRPNGVAACTGILPGLLTAGHTEGSTLVVGMITTGSFGGPVDIVRCRVAVEGSVHPDQFTYSIEDATTPAGDPVDGVQVVLRVTE